MRRSTKQSYRRRPGKGRNKARSLMGRGTKKVAYGKQHGKAQITIGVGNETFTANRSQLARVREIREAKHTMSIPQSTNGGGHTG